MAGLVFFYLSLSPPSPRLSPPPPPSPQALLTAAAATPTTCTAWRMEPPAAVAAQTAIPAAFTQASASQPSARVSHCRDA